MSGPFSQTDPERLPGLIHAARIAIDTRSRELQTDSNGYTVEHQAMADALAGLRILQQELNSKSDKN